MRLVHSERFLPVPTIDGHEGLCYTNADGVLHL